MKRRRGKKKYSKRRSYKSYRRNHYNAQIIGDRW